MQDSKLLQSYTMSGLFTLSLRLVVGWTYFSAFWRRLILENKLDPEASGYIGEKFNHFLPNALGIKPIIEYLVTHPDSLWWAMAVFTIIEGIVGLLLMLGLFTRLMSIGVFGLAMGILLGSGWLGTTCLDEWQIGILGIASGFTLFLSGSGKYSLDYLLLKKQSKITASPFFSWLGSGLLPIRLNLLHKLVFSGSVLILFITLFTNQYFHGGVWGSLHNKSVKPKIELQDTKITKETLSFQVYRTEGADVYGSFLIGIQLSDASGNTIIELDGTALSEFPKEQIQNFYVTKVKNGKHSMLIPLGAKAVLSIKDEKLSVLPKGKYNLTLIDISGATWSEAFEI
ncbi:TQO small subunit DoxD [Flavobacterium granuli]|uniref:Thiosulfate dehydrogenase [quinone] large subunit n=1 Tax=Flavobacterium granuli TaxID=280093 RepID=A0A1M5T4A1_9FLAO|nr:TQO small subunit DoxD [Flavobacterium granuli]PRZ20689.1 thiosulfate dehydrogenase [quinone] large subunit [Flavobacterium granuli]SHH45554.1 thiosulfate dehydrogenase [quinone] large subunit [Flavobacterium granuli]